MYFPSEADIPQHDYVQTLCPCRKVKVAATLQIRENVVCIECDYDFVSIIAYDFVFLTLKNIQMWKFAKTRFLFVHHVMKTRSIHMVTQAIRWLDSILGVSINRGTRKSSILVGCPTMNHQFWGTPLLGKPHVDNHRIDLQRRLPCSQRRLLGQVLESDCNVLKT